MPNTDETRQERLQNYLTAEKQRLWNELRVELFGKISDELHSQYDVPQDAGDLVSLSQLDYTGLSVVDIRRRKLAQMEWAISKLKDGSYGICDDCGENIIEARLQVAPDSIRCVECQHQHEKTVDYHGQPTFF